MEQTPSSIQDFNQEMIKITKDTFHTALLQLMATMPFEGIKTTDIVKRSGMSRSAFYRHYHNKWDLLEEMRKDHMEILFRITLDPKHKGNFHSLLVTIFRYLKQDPYRTKLGYKVYTIANPRPLHNHFIEKLQTPIDTRQKYLMSGCEAALTSIGLEWIEGGMKESPEELADICIDLFTAFDKHHFV